MAYSHSTLEQYLADAASDKPAPGGGSVAALAGALAACMGEMASNFTVGRKRFKDVQAEAKECLETLSSCRLALLGLVDADVEAYQAVGQAYAMPRKSREEISARARAIQAALREAMQPPMRVMRCCALVGQTAARLVKIANPNLLTDVGVCAILAEAACAAARINVEVNLKYIEEERLVAETRPEVEGLCRSVGEARRAVSRAVEEYLSG